eukprot:7842806-Pyramimonas_sp.AAC.1
MPRTVATPQGSGCSIVISACLCVGGLSATRRVNPSAAKTAWFCASPPRPSLARTEELEKARDELERERDALERKRQEVEESRMKLEAADRAGSGEAAAGGSEQQEATQLEGPTGQVAAPELEPSA